MMEGTLEEWERWFETERSPDWKMTHSFATFPEQGQCFVRLWTVAEGKTPDDVPFHRGKIWNKMKTAPLRPNTCILTGPCPPLMLTTPEHLNQASEQYQFPATLPGLARSTKLEQPYLWRCRVCGEEGVMTKSQRHCERPVRQLARVNEETANWFGEFLKQTKWKFIEPSQLRVPSHGYYDDEVALNLARKAGKQFEEHMNRFTIESPSVYELFDRRTPHLRVSDLKAPKKIKEALESAVKFSKGTHGILKRKPSPSTIELGGVFDEYLDKAINSISSDIWQGKQSVSYRIEPFDVVVRGTPDNFLQAVPIETKTVSMLPHRGRKSKPIRWNNYLTQLAIHSRACGFDWMFLLMISRADGEFSIIPFRSSKRMEEMEQEWDVLVKGKKFNQLLDEYRTLQNEIHDSNEE